LIVNNTELQLVKLSHDVKSQKALLNPKDVNMYLYNTILRFR